MSDAAPETSASTSPATQVTLPIWLKLTLMASLFAVIPGAIVLALVVDYATTDLIRVQQERQRILALALEANVEKTISGAVNDLHATAHALMRNELDAEAREQLALVLVGSSELLDHVDIYERTGARIDRLREQRGLWSKDPDPTMDSHLREDAESKDFAWGSIVRYEGDARITLAVPVRNKETNKTVFYLVSRVPFRFPQDQIQGFVRDWFGGDQDALMLLDNQLRIIAHSSQEQAAKLEPAPVTVLLKDYIAPTMFRKNIVRSERFIDLEGKDRLGTLQPMARLPFAVLVQEQSDSVLSVLSLVRNYALLLLSIAFVLSVICSVLVARLIANPIKKLTGFAEVLSKRQFDKRITVQTRDELAVLGDSMSQAAANLEASEERILKEEAIRSDLGRYLSKELVKAVVNREQDMNLGGERQVVTVLFADIVAFTPLSERLAPEDVVGILNQLFTILTEIVFRHGGTVDKFIGDCMMAFWGAPTSHEDDAKRALSAAEDMLQWLEIGNANWSEEFGITLELAIGINTGEVLVGNVGSETRMEYTVIGDVVNIAARLEALARPQQILTTDATRREAGEYFEYVPLGTRDVSGHTEPIVVFEVQP